MRTGLKRLLDWLRAPNYGTFGKGASTRRGLEQPQRMDVVSASVRARP
jgi:hypothetical protein